MLLQTIRFVADPRAIPRLDEAIRKGEGLTAYLGREYQWEKVAHAHLKIEGSCQCCTVVRELEVHHVIPWHVDESLRFLESNLITLCRPCHYRFGHWMKWTSYNPEIRALCQHIAEERRRVA